MWGQCLLEDLLAGRYRSLVCAVNAKDNGHGIITELAVGVGAKVAKGDKLLTMEAMKMQTTVYAAADGVVDVIHIDIGESVEAKDLVMELREA